MTTNVLSAASIFARNFRPLIYGPNLSLVKVQRVDEFKQVDKIDNRRTSVVKGLVILY